MPDQSGFTPQDHERYLEQWHREQADMENVGTELCPIWVDPVELPWTRLEQRALYETRPVPVDRRDILDKMTQDAQDNGGYDPDARFLNPPGLVPPVFKPEHMYDEEGVD